MFARGSCDSRGVDAGVVRLLLRGRTSSDGLLEESNLDPLSIVVVVVVGVLVYDTVFLLLLLTLLIGLSDNNDLDLGLVILILLLLNPLLLLLGVSGLDSRRVLYSLSLGWRSFTVKSCLFLSTNLSTMSIASFSKYRRILLERSLSSIGTPDECSSGGRLGPSSSSPNMSVLAIVVELLVVLVLVLVDDVFFILEEEEEDFFPEVAVLVGGGASTIAVTLVSAMREMDSLSESCKVAFGRG